MTSDLEDALPSLRSQEGGSGGGRRLLLRLPDALQPGAGSASGGGAGEAETLAMAQLLPVRAAMRGSFPLAGTYFQVLVVDQLTCNPPVEGFETCGMHYRAILNAYRLAKVSHFCVAQINEVFLDIDTITTPLQVQP